MGTPSASIPQNQREATLPFERCRTIFFLDNPNSEVEVDTAVTYLKNKKGPWSWLYFSITNEMIKASLPVLGTALVKLFNLIL